MLYTNTENAELFIGKNAGDDLYKSIQGAKKSIKILSPYISPEYIDLLLTRRSEGLDIFLLTGSDMANPKKRAEIYEKLIIQRQHLDERAKKIRRNGMLISFFCILITLAVCYLGYRDGSSDLLWGLALIPIFAIILNLFKKKRIYTYTYDTLLDFAVLVSPYEQQIDSTQFFVHSKIYVIDEKMAYVGSVNFTKKAFRHNYECSVKITDQTAVSKISQEINTLTNSEGTFYRIINEIGSSIFAEPPN